MIVVNPKDITEASKLASYADAFLVGIKDYIPSFFNPFSYDDFIKLNSLNKIIILRLDILVNEKDLSFYKDLILKVKDLNIYYYITDLGILNILKSLNLINKIIYDPFTMICNKLDAKYYYDLGICAVAPSLEIPYKDVREFNVPLFYLGFGRRLMFNSKRLLLSLYKEEKNLDFKTDNLSIIEEKRNDIFPIFEDMGTYIYRSYYLNNLIITKDNKNIKFLFIDSLTIDSLTYFKLVEAYYKYYNNIIALNEFKDLINELNLKIEDGFTYQDSVYQKEELFDEKN